MTKSKKSRCPKLQEFVNCKLKLIKKFENFSTPFLLLGIRLYMANVFFKSGKLKLASAFDGGWQGTVDLFTYEHPFKLRADLAEKWGIKAVEIIPPNIAAVMGAAGEVLFSGLLAFGLFGRIGALGLLGMTAVIQFTYKDYESHYFWAMLLCVILVKGAGKFSLDNFILGFCGAKK